jgi:hypothetical protein
MAEQLLTAAQHARDAAADPDPMPPQRTLRIAEKAVKRHRVRHLSRVQFQDLGNFLNCDRRHRSQRIMHDVKRWQRHRPLVRVFLELRSNTLSQLVAQHTHQNLCLTQRRQGAKKPKTNHKVHKEHEEEQYRTE